MATRYDDVIKATTGLARRAGATSFFLTHNSTAPYTQWFAHATFDEAPVREGAGGDPGAACMELAAELLDGSVCRRCKHVISLFSRDPQFCRWHLRGDVWLSGCGMPVDQSTPMVARQ